MRKILIIFSILICTLFTNCGKNPLGPEDPSEMGGTIEILYERILPIVNPYAGEPTGAAMVYHWKYKFKRSSKFVKVGENKWKAEIYLLCDPQPYYIDKLDAAVTIEYRTIARKFSLRVKGEERWTELKCVVNNPTGPGESAKFIFNHGRIRNPIRCED